MNRQAASQTHQASAAAPPQAGGILQRQCDCGQHTIAGGSCDECGQKLSSLQRRTRNSELEAESPGGVPRIVHDVLHSPGQPLDGATRAFMEPRFGHDFSRIPATSERSHGAVSALRVGPAVDRFELEADHIAETVMRAPARAESPVSYDFSRVRVHADGRAAESARAVNAKAYTVGDHIVFGAGEYAPESSAGRKVIAHELAHTLQQSNEGAARTAQLQRTIGDGHDLQAPRFSGNERLEAAFDDERLISKGSQGTHVRLIQQSLIDQGYPLPFGGADGIFGPETEAAVKRFQTDAGALKIDGLVGPETMGLLDQHDTTLLTGVGPVALKGPLAAPAPKLATCDAPFKGVTFALANQVATGANPSVNLRDLVVGGKHVLQMLGTAQANYNPRITIAAPSNAKAQEFQVGFASNMLSDAMEYTFSNGIKIRTTLPFPIKDGLSLSGGQYDPVFVTSSLPGLLVDFTANGAAVNLTWPDKPQDFAFVNLSDNPACAGQPSPATLVRGFMIDTFRTWVAVRHKASGCVRSLHHIDWDINWAANVAVPAAGGASTVTPTSTALNVTEPDGDGSPAFIQGGLVPDNFRGHNRSCGP
jgi:peptidoglycan hydrolase-like protein with peptidoglycan-binding domain